MKHVILIFFCLLFCSCRQGGGKNDLALLHEASLHTAQPDSVMDLLGQIVRPDCLQGKARADYALLYTEALNKQDRIGTDDSLIKLALGYYSKQAPGIPLAKSYFLLGRICQQQGNDTLALKVNLQALAALPSQTQDRTRMLVNYDLGYLYHQKGFYRQALLHYREMQKYVDAHPDTTDCYIAAYSMGDIFMLLNRYDSAYHYYQEAISFARQLENESYERYIIRQLCLHARLTGNRQQAKAYLQEIVDTYGNDFYNKAVLFKEEGNADSASFYFLKATKNSQIITRAMSFYHLFQLHRKAHPDWACVYVDSFHIYKDSLYALRQTDKIERLTAAYRQEVDRQKEEADRRENAICLWGGIGITLLLCGTGVFFFVQRKKRRYLLLEKQLVANRLAAIKEYVAEQNRRNPEEWSAMYQEIAAIEMQTLIGQFQQTAWQKRIHAIQKGNGKPFSKKEQEAFQKETLALFDEPVKRLQVEYPQITEADLLFCLLSFMDYPTSLIASCTGRKENALRTCKHRLKEKLSKEIFGFFFHFTNNQQDTE
ncbi:tetratricopeptide repeat protein [Bacteroides sp. An51A]|uniref:tetratricopeptide repeat protein n=1 Tax=Bacteroides sp. An51A TaxID=1965640 RepID=UPI001177A6F6|nr:tetratricopeptide repeat protein [Bacteroides sp. An51A]